MIGIFSFANVGGPTLVNRALQCTSGASTAYLTLPGTATAILSQNWRIAVRLRIDSYAGSSYLFARTVGGSDDYSIVYNFTANKIALFSNNNSTGSTKTLAMNTAITPGATFYLVEFTYDGTTLRTFLNGVADGTLAVSNMTLWGVSDGIIALGRRNSTGGAPSNVTIDSVVITDNGAQIVNLQLNEPSPGPYANTGTAGGTLTLSSPVPASFNV